MENRVVQCGLIMEENSKLILNKELSGALLNSYSIGKNAMIIIKKGGKLIFSPYGFILDDCWIEVEEDGVIELSNNVTKSRATNFRPVSNKQFGSKPHQPQNKFSLKNESFNGDQ